MSDQPRPKPRPRPRPRVATASIGEAGPSSAPGSSSAVSPQKVDPASFFDRTRDANEYKLFRALEARTSPSLIKLFINTECTT